MISSKWIIPQNSCDIDQMYTTIKTFKKLNGIVKEKDVLHSLMTAQSSGNLYHPRNEMGVFDVSSANHKIDEAEFYGAIYETPNRKIHVSAYGELLLKHWDDIVKRNKIFIGMSFNVQFPHPNKPGLEDFEIYPIRLIFTLLLDKRLDNELTNSEIAGFLYDVHHVKNKNEYEEIVEKILEFRKKDAQTKKLYLSSFAADFVKAMVSCNYMFNIFKKLGVVSEILDKEKDFKIQSPNREKPSNISFRLYRIDHDYVDFVTKYCELFPVYDQVKKCEEQLKSDWIQDVYDTVPTFLLEQIDEHDDMFTEYLQIPLMMKDLSTNSSKWAEFEECITKAYNLFSDVEAERLGQPGEPDTLCRYLKNNTLFTADGKSTEYKLGSINDGRLRQHREKYSAEYTIIVTPRYTPSAVQDIKGTNVCIITSFCFAELITNYIFKFYESKKDCSYAPIDKIIHENMGTDISQKIYQLIDDELGVQKNEAASFISET